MEKFVIGAALLAAGVFAVSAMVGESVMHIDISDAPEVAVPAATAPAPVGKPQTYAAARLRIEDAAAIVTILPEERADIELTVTQPGKLPALDARVRGDELVLDGRLGARIRSCSGEIAEPQVTVSGYGDLGRAELAQITLRVPKAAALAVGGAVYGTVGQSASLTLESNGCGDLLVADVAGLADVSLSGSGAIALGKVGQGKARLAGSGDLTIADVRDGLDAAVAGSGMVKADFVKGKLDARITGSGDVGVEGGAISTAALDITGSGDIAVEAVVETLTARVIGSGDVSVREVTGAITREVMGSGEIEVKHSAAPAPPAPPPPAAPPQPPAPPPSGPPRSPAL